MKKDIQILDLFFLWKKMHHFNSKVALDAQKTNGIFLLLLFYDWAWRGDHLRPAKVYHWDPNMETTFFKCEGVLICFAMMKKWKNDKLLFYFWYLVNFFSDKLIFFDTFTFFSAQNSPSFMKCMNMLFSWIKLIIKMFIVFLCD